MKVTTISNYRLVVWPRSVFYSMPDRRACEDMKTQIQRHVDNVDGVEIEHDELHRCSFCNLEWEVYTEHDEAYLPECKVGMPVCCQAAQAEWLNTQGDNS